MKAAKQLRIPLSTFWRELREKRNQARFGAPTALTKEGEGAIVKIHNDYAERGHPCTRIDIGDMVELMVSRLTPARGGKIRFRNGRPGRDYL